MKRISLLCIEFLILLLLISCSGGPAVEEEKATDANTVVITREQYTLAGMKTGMPEIRKFEDRLTTTAVISLPPDGMAGISAPVAGTVSSIRHKPGDFVKKGTVLLLIKSMEGIALQQDYAETTSRYMAVKENYERQKVLLGENVTSRKEFLNLEGDYKSLLAQWEGLKARVKLLNIDPGKVAEGKIADEIPLIASIDGFITRIDAITGQFVNPGTMLLEQINSDKYQLVLKIFGQDVGKLKPGQKVLIPLSDGQKLIPAVLTTIGKTLDPTTRTIDCVASLTGNQSGEFVLGMVYKAFIILDERESPSLPGQALIKSGNQFFVLVLEKDTPGQLIFRRTKVDLGYTQNGFSEILHTAGLKDILMNGVSDIPVEE